MAMWFAFFLLKARQYCYGLCWFYRVTVVMLGVLCAVGELYAQTGVIKSTEGIFFNSPDTAHIKSLLREGYKMQMRSMDSAKPFYFEAYELYRGNMPLSIKGEICAQLAWIYWMTAQYDSSISFWREAIAVEKILGRHQQLLHLYTKMAGSYADKGSGHMAFLSLYDALELIRKNPKLRSTKEATLVYDYMAHTWKNLGEEKLQQLYLDSAYKIARLLKDTFTKIGVYVSKAANMVDTTGRIALFKEALELSRRSGSKRQEAICLMYLGANASNEGKMDEAFGYLNRALRIREGAGPVSGGLQLVPNYYLARAYFANKQYSRAENLLRTVLVSAEEMQNKAVIREAHLLLSKIYAEQQQYQNAYRHTELYQALLDTTLRMEKEKTVEFLLQYQALEKDKNIARKELLITRQQKDLQAKNFWIGGISLGLVFSGGLLLLLVRSYRHKQHLQNAAIVNLTQQQKIDQLQIMMQSEEKERNRIARELHDGVGSQIAAARMHLDIFKEGTVVPEYAKTYGKGLQLLDDAYKGLRYTAHNLLPEQLLERGLIPVVQEYCNKISRPGLLAIHFQSFGVLPPLAPDKALSVYRIVQELIHNALKHADATEIVVELGLEEPHLFVSVEDNGKGWEADIDSGSGIGLHNLKQRVELIRGILEIDSREGIGTTIYMNLPLKEIVA